MSDLNFDPSWRLEPLPVYLVTSSSESDGFPPSTQKSSLSVELINNHIELRRKLNLSVRPQSISDGQIKALKSSLIIAMLDWHGSFHVSQQPLQTRVEIKMKIKHHLKTVLETQETGKAPAGFDVTETEFMELLWSTPLFCWPHCMKADFTTADELWLFFVYLLLSSISERTWAISWLL